MRNGECGMRREERCANARAGTTHHAQSAIRSAFREGTADGCGVLLIHGLTASPTEVQPIADFLGQSDPTLTISSPLLPGHGTTPEALRGTDPATWSRCVADEIERLATRRGGVIVVGVSMGAVLAAEGTIRDPRVRGLVMLAPVFGIGGIRGLALPLLKHVKPFVRKSRASVENHRAKGLFSYDRYAVTSLLQLRELGRRVRPALHRVAVPTLLAAGRRDRYVPWRSVERLRSELLANRQTGFRLEFVECPRSGHVLPHEPDSANLLLAIGGFVAALDERSP